MPDLNAIMPWLVASAGTAVGAFILAVLADDILGIVLAVKAGKFDWNRLPSFLESELGTKAALALLGLVVTAVLTAGVSGTSDIRGAALAALTAGAAAKTASVVADAVSKARALIA
jgi:hypothetical protein